MTALRTATVDEVAAVQEVEVRAAARFVSIGLAALAAGTPTDRATLAAAAADDRLVVAVAGAIVGFALWSSHADAAHLDEIDVVPEAGGRGLGRRLLDEIAARARARGCAALTLTTFRDVPWNGPFYARAGFTTIPEPLPPRLAAIRAAERARGLEVVPRIAMARPL